MTVQTDVSAIPDSSKPARLPSRLKSRSVSNTLDAFGEDIMAYGSSWPMTLLGTPYTRGVAALDEITASLSPVAKHKLWAGNAAKVIGWR